MSSFLAERKGFEPLNAFNTLHDFQSCAFDQLSHLSMALLLNSFVIVSCFPGKVKHFFRNFRIFLPPEGNSGFSVPTRGKMC